MFCSLYHVAEQVLLLEVDAEIDAAAPGSQPTCWTGVLKRNKLDEHKVTQEVIILGHHTALTPQRTLRSLVLQSVRAHRNRARVRQRSIRMKGQLAASYSCSKLTSPG